MNTFEFPSDMKTEHDGENIWLIFEDLEETAMKQIHKSLKKFLNDNNIGFISYRKESFFISQDSYNKIKELNVQL